MRKYLLPAGIFLWHVVVSVEFLVLFIAVCLYCYCSFVRESFGGVNVGSELKYGLLAMIIGVAAWVFAESKEIFWPNVESKTVLLEWPNYPHLKSCCLVANLYALLCATFAVAGAIFEDNVSKGLALYSTLVSIIVILIDAASCWLANIQIRQLLEWFAKKQQEMNKK